jgi:hypothetical protein
LLLVGSLAAAHVGASSAALLAVVLAQPPVALMLRSAALWRLGCRVRIPAMPRDAISLRG